MRISDWSSDVCSSDLVADIERLREHLRVDRWMVFGGSWGSTLALAYGQAHPQRCLGFMLRGIFLGRTSELDWFLHGVRTLYPDAWRRFAEFLPEGERGDLLAGYHDRLCARRPEGALPAERRRGRPEGGARAP